MYIFYIFAKFKLWKKNVAVEQAMQFLDYIILTSKKKLFKKL